MTRITIRGGIMARVLFLVVPLLSALPGFAQEPEPVPVEKRIEAWTAQLGHEEYEVRETASEKIVEIGVWALPALKALARDSTDAEKKLRATHAIRAIEGGRPRDAGDPMKASLPGSCVGTTSSSIGGFFTMTVRADDRGNVQLDVKEFKTGTELKGTFKGWKQISELIRLGWNRQEAEKTRKPGGTRIYTRTVCMLVEAVAPLLRHHVDLPPGKGVTILDFPEDGLAKRIGIRKFDIIRAVDGEDVSGPGDLEPRLKAFRVIRVLRKGREIEITSEPGKKPGAGDRKSD